MRDAINNNPRVQMIVIGVMLVIGVFLLFTKVLKKDDAVPVDPQAAAEQAALDAGNVNPTAPTSSTGAAAPATATDSAAATPDASGTRWICQMLLRLTKL